MKKYQIFIPIFWIGASLFVLYHAYKLGLEEKIGAEEFYNPGPGLMPFVAGLLLFLLALFILGKEFFRKAEKIDKAKEGGGQINFGKIGIVLASLFAYLVFFETLGYVVTTSLFLIFLFRSMGLKRWTTILVVSVGSALITYFSFTYLGLILPQGILKI